MATFDLTKSQIMSKKIFSILSISILLVSCGGGSSETTEETKDTVAACTYSYDSSATELTWTAFKLTEKIGVNGTFNEINVVANDGAPDMFAVLNGATFSIPVSSLNTQDNVRDGKIKNSFFGNMAATDLLTGNVVSISNSGATVAITMNEVTKEYSGEVIVDGETITVKTGIDILDFNGQVPMDSLSVVCSEKHTGPDGINKLWSTVDIVVKTTLIKNCQ